MSELPLIGQKELAVGYGVMDMRAGEGLTEAEYQIKTNKQVKLWYFDIIHTPNQTQKAEFYQEEVRQIVHRFTGLEGDRINVQLNTNDRKILKARNDLFKTAHERRINTVETEIVNG